MSNLDRFFREQEADATRAQRRAHAAGRIERQSRKDDEVAELARSISHKPAYSFTVLPVEKPSVDELDEVLHGYLATFALEREAVRAYRQRITKELGYVPKDDDEALTSTDKLRKSVEQCQVLDRRVRKSSRPQKKLTCLELLAKEIRVLEQQRQVTNTLYERAQEIEELFQTEGSKAVKRKTGIIIAPQDSGNFFEALKDLKTRLGLLMSIGTIYQTRGETYKIVAASYHSNGFKPF